MKHAPTGFWKKLRWPGGILLLGIGWVGLQLASETIEESGFTVNTPVLADEQPFPIDDAADVAEDDDGYTARLSFFNATWPTILRKLAADTNSKLEIGRAHV